MTEGVWAGGAQGCTGTRAGRATGREGVAFGKWSWQVTTPVVPLR